MNRKSTMHGSSAVALDSLREKVSETGHNIAELGHLAKRAAYASVGDGKEKLMQLEGKLEGRIQRQPMKSVLIAAAIGMAFGLILRRL